MKIIVALSILALLVLLIQNKIKPSILFGSVATLYFLLGFIDLNVWLGSYMQSSLIILILLLLVSIAIEKSIIIKSLSKFIIGKNYHLSLLKLGITTTTISAFLNNTAVVASFMSIIKHNKFQNPSKLLIPLSYFSIAGGTMTLIGTSTNLIVNSFVIENGLPSLQIFDFFLIGFCISFTIIATMIIFSFLLPNYQNKNETPNTYFINAKILDNSPLAGKSVKDNNLRNLNDIFLIEIHRGNTIISPASHNDILENGDILIFSGNVNHLIMLEKIQGLEIEKPYTEIQHSNLVDVIISPTSNLIGKSVKEVNFRSKFDAGIIAIKRGANNISKIGQCILEGGDRLILNTGKDFYLRNNIAKNFYFISNIQQNKQLNLKQSIFILFSFLFIIALSATNTLPLLKSLLVFLGVLLLFKIISFDEIKRRFPLEIFIIIGSSLAITKVLVDSGLAKDLAFVITSIFKDYGVYGSFIGTYLLTLILTEIITNNAAAALAFPIGFATALALNVSPTPFIFAVAYGASAGFMIPHSYQTHLMVSSICGYNTRDFMKIGWIISIVYSAVVLLLTPYFFKF